MSVINVLRLRHGVYFVGIQIFDVVGSVAFQAQRLTHILGDKPRFPVAVNHTQFQARGAGLIDHKGMGLMV